MSSGDGSIDNKCASIAKLRQLTAENPLINRQMAQTPAFNMDFDVPFIAGAANSLKTVYFHRLFKPMVTIGPRIVDLRHYMWRHEILEALLVLFFGYSYDDKPDAAHEFGNLAEELALEADGISYTAYNAKIDIQVKVIDKAPIVRCPPDLLLYPYQNSPGILAKIQRAQAHG